MAAITVSETFSLPVTWLLMFLEKNILVQFYLLCYQVTSSLQLVEFTWHKAMEFFTNRARRAKFLFFFKIEVKFTEHELHHFKVKNLVAFDIFAILCHCHI